MEGSCTGPHPQLPLCTEPAPRLVQLGPHCTPLPEVISLFHYEVSVGEWAVGIQLKYFPLYS